MWMVSAAKYTTYYRTWWPEVQEERRRSRRLKVEGGRGGRGSGPCLRGTGKVGQGERNGDSMSGFIKRLKQNARREYPGNMVLLKEWGALLCQSTKASKAMAAVIIRAN
jgi:hypothetical protein